VLHAKIRNERDRLQTEVNELFQENFALQNAMRVILEDSSGTVAARPVLPNEDSLRTIIRREVLAEIEAAGGEVISGGEVVVDMPDTTVTGTGSGDNTVADTLRYSIDEETWLASISVGLTVHPVTDTFEYELTLEPKPQNFKFYTVERDLGDDRRVVEVWVDVPGRVESLRSFILPKAIPQPKPSKGGQRLYLGGRAVVATGLKGTLIAGPEFGVESRWRFLRLNATAGYDMVNQGIFSTVGVGFVF